MPERIYRFDTFELNVGDGELRSNGNRLRLQDKPLRLLCALLENPQHTVTREELRERMWPSHTFVDFERGINVAIKKVRDALGDSAESPVFIQTVSKRGYRFLLPVSIVDAPIISQVIAPAAARENRPRDNSNRDNSHTAASRRWLWVGLAVAILSATGFSVFELQTKHHSLQIHSIAVLPLRNLSPDADQDYFADGITEELITNLAQTLPLRVISRTSVMRYKQTNESVAQIAHELGVEAIVEGAVARSGDHVAVTIQLVDATQDRHMWAQKYDRRMEDLLSLEAELSQEIGSQVSGTLASQHVIKAANRRPVDPKVYELCLLGRYQWNKRTEAGLQKSIEYFQQAIELDPEYAPAYAGLANAYVILPSYSSVGWEEFYSKGADAARRALALDDTLAEAHATLGFIGINHWESESKESEKEFRRAIELNPSYATAHHWFAFHRFFAERHEEALAEMETARQLDPLSAIINADEGEFLYAAGRKQEARTRLLQAIDLAPDLGQPHETLALLASEAGQTADAWREARRGLTLDPDNPRTLGEAGYVFAVSGHIPEARKLLSTLTDQVHRGSAFPSHAALLYVGLGERSKALDILEQASRTGAGVHAWSQWPAFEQLKDEPRYQKLLAEAQSE